MSPDRAVALLCIDPWKMGVCVHIEVYTGRFIALLFTIAKKVEITWMFIKWRMGKPDVDPCNGILFNHKKRCTDSCTFMYNINEHWKHDNERSQSQKSSYCMFPLIGSVRACVTSHFSGVQLFVTLWTVARQAALSMGFSGQEYWNGLPFPSPGDFPNPGIELMFPALAGRFFTTSTTREAHKMSKMA